MLDSVDSVWTAITDAPEFGGTREIFASEGPLKVALANALLAKAKRGVLRCADSSELTGSVTVPRQGQYTSRFGSFDIGFADKGQPYALFEAKYARTREGKGGTAPHSTLFQFIYDLVVLRLEHLDRMAEGVSTSVFAVALVVAADFARRHSENGREFPSAWSQLFSISEGASRTLKLQPSKARDNPGQGGRAIARFDEPESLTRNHISIALTGAINAKLLGLFLRPPFVLEIDYRYRAEKVGTQYVLVVAEPLAIRVRDHVGALKDSLNDVLEFIP